MSDDSRYGLLVRLIKEANTDDPNVILVDGVSMPREQAYAEKHLEWLLVIQPEASEWLRIAVQTQHICRWKIPRGEFPMNRAGYLRWREELKRFHARLSGELMAQAGYNEVAVRRVQDLNLKKGLKVDPECQALEDALCLTFLELGFDDLIAKHDEDKLVSVVAKTAAKMSPEALSATSAISFSSTARRILGRALAPGS